MRATAEPVEGNVVRLSIEIDETEVDRVLNDAVKSLSRQLRIPGFRPGKVPRQILEARLGGAGALRAEALRDAMPDFYAQAVVETEVDPIAPPDIDITAGKDAGPVTLDAVVQVRPTVAIPGYEGLEVTVPSITVTDEDLSRQVDRLRENDGELVEVSRPAADGDHATIDIHGTDTSGTEVLGADDFVYEVGGGRVVPELDVQLRGAKVGDVLAFTASPEGADDPVSFRVLVKNVQEKRLPDADDAWAAESSEFATLDELRADIGQRIGRVKIVQAQLALQENAMAALAELVNEDDVPEVLVDEELGERLADLSHRLEDQGISLDAFLTATGRSAEELINEQRADARRAVRVDLALRALADAEELSVSDGDLDAEIVASAERLDADPGTLRARLDRSGRTAAVRSELRKKKAMSWLLDHVAVIDETGEPVSLDDLRVNQADGEEHAETSGDTVVDGTAASDGPDTVTADEDGTTEEETT
jgi:trigger factor